MNKAPPEMAPKKTITSKVVGKPAAPSASSPKARPVSKPAPVPKAIKAKRGFFHEQPIVLDVVANEQVERDHYQNLLSKIFFKAIVIATLVGILILFTPFFEPVYLFYARDSNGNASILYGLTMPNMTNRAILSWSVTSVTEIMTFGFADLIPHLQSQKARFTSDGWSSFVDAFHKQKINETFKEHELVVTTVPSDTPVIIWQGPTLFGVYQWVVQVPVITTYATNDNVTEGRHAFVTLVIVRVPAEQSPSGIAIKKWYSR